MKLNKKGFTLIELLAVLVILMLVLTLAVPNITTAIQKNKEKQDQVKIELIISNAELYYESHKNSYPSKENTCINISVLNLSDKELKNSTGDKITGSVRWDSSKNAFVYNAEVCLI